MLLLCDALSIWNQVVLYEALTTWNKIVLCEALSIWIKINFVIFTLKIIYSDQE